MKKSELPLSFTCDKPWGAMAGGDRARHCDHCDKQVHNLSEMPQAEAQALLLAKARGDQELCIRYRSDRSGQVRFRERGRRIQALERTLRRGALAMAMLAPGGDPR